MIQDGSVTRSFLPLTQLGSREPAKWISVGSVNSIRADTGRAVRTRAPQKQLRLRWPQGPFSLLHQRRGDLVPRRSAPTESFAQGS